MSLKANSNKKVVFQFEDKRAEIILITFITKSESIQIFIRFKWEMISVSFAAKRLMEKRMKFSETIQQMYPLPLPHFSGDLPRIIKSNALYLLLIHLQGIRQLRTVPGVQKKKKKIEAEYHEHTIIREVRFSFLTLCGASPGP